MKRKMTEEELSTILVDKLTFITTDKKGKETTWRTTWQVAHSSWCDNLSVNDFEEDK